MSIPPVGAPRKGGTTLLKIILIALAIWAFSVISHDDMCTEMNHDPEQCQIEEGK